MPAGPAANGPRASSPTVRHRTRPSSAVQMRCTLRRLIRSGSPCSSMLKTALELPLAVPSNRVFPEPSRARTRPSAEETIANRLNLTMDHPSHGSWRLQTTLPRRSCPLSCCSRRHRASQAIPGGDPSGASMSSGGSVGSNMEPTVGSPTGSKTMSWPSLVVAAAKPSGPIARSSTGLRNSRFQTQRAEGVTRPIRSRSCTRIRPNVSGRMARWVSSTRLKSSFRCMLRRKS